MDATQLAAIIDRALAECRSRMTKYCGCEVCEALQAVLRILEEAEQ